jgi:hypothetical protein
VPKYAILAEHCAAVGRDFAEIERSNLQPIALTDRGAAWGQRRESPDQLVERFGRLAEAGVQHVILSVGDADDADALEALGRDVIPQLRGVEAADPRRITSTAV